MHSEGDEGGSRVHKVVWFVRFRQDRDRDEIDRRWANEHAALCLKVPGVQRYVQNPVVTTATLEGASDGPPPFDGFAAFWWADRDSYLAAVETPEWQAVLDDSRELFDVEWTLDGMGAEIEERVIREGLGAKGDGVGTPPRGPVKLIGLLQYRKDMSRDQANAYWAGTHTDIAVKIRQIGHYTQNHAIRPSAGSDHLAFDGFSESWYEDFDVYNEAMASPEWKELADDGDNLFDMSAFKSAIVEERVLKA
jgi:uncharacterized protein (TIGR02118 family)